MGSNRDEDPSARYKIVQFKHVFQCLQQFERSIMPWIGRRLSKKATETQLNAQFVSGGLRSMPKGENYNNVNIVFPFLAGFLDQCSGWIKKDPLTEIHVLYSKLMLSMTTDCKGWGERQLMGVKFYLDQINNKSIERRFSYHCNFKLYSLKFHLQDHVI